MVHIDLSSKRARLALRFFTYGVMTLATVVLTFLAIFYAMGYRFNQNQLTFEQGGLMQFRSSPQGATVVIDGKSQSFKTPGRANVPSGRHVVEMRLKGYHTWRKTVDLTAGQLLWLNYTRFVPLSMTTTPHRTFESLHGISPSPDRKWMILQEKPDSPVLTLVDVNDEKKPVYTPLTIPDLVLTKRDGKLGELKIIEWDRGSRYVLIEHRLGDQREFLRLDRSRPAETTNLSQRFRLNILEAHFAGTNANQIYVRTDDVLRRLDIGSDVASVALATGIRTFQVAPDGAVGFIAERETVLGDPASREQNIGVFKDNKEVIVRHYPIGATLAIAYSDYFGHAYLAVSSGDQKVHVLRDPLTTQGDVAEFATFDVSRPVQQLSFGGNGRMLVAANGGSVTAYDIELNKTTHSILNTSTDEQALPAWLDDYYLWTDVNGVLRIVEFDGQNDHEITKVAPGYGAMLSNNGKVLFSIAKDTLTPGFILQSSRLVTD